jgi:cephalosporin hydroxylase
MNVEKSLALILTTWGRGAAMHKEPPDLARYEILIDRIRPRVVVECGLFYGGSQLWFAERVPYHIAVEMNPETTRDYMENKHGLGEPPLNGFVVMGNSHRVYPQVAALTKLLAGNEPILVVLDSNHDTNTVYGELQLYHQLVTPGSYLVCEDGILHYMRKGEFPHGNWFDGDPLLAIEKWLPDHQEFVPDMELEAMFDGATAHPKGWLRRTK